MAARDCHGDSPAGSDETLTLFRPVGQREKELIEHAGYRAFPPRLPHQPFFYPVLNEAYAVRIARDWNTKDSNSGFTGYVLRFRVSAAYLSRYPVRTVGGAMHKEYWIPAEGLTEFNANIIGLIEVVAHFAGTPPC